MKIGQIYKYIGPGVGGVGFQNGNTYPYIEGKHTYSTGNGSGSEECHYFEKYTGEEKETKELSARDLYTQMQKLSGFKVGDKVKIVRGFKGDEWGANCGYVKDLDDCIGKEVEITRIIDNGIEINNDWFFPFFCLEKVVAPPIEIKLNAEYTAVIAGDKQTVRVGCQVFSREKILELAKELN